MLIFVWGHRIAKEVEKLREEGKRWKLLHYYIIWVILRPMFQSLYLGTHHLKIPYPDSAFICFCSKSPAGAPPLV